MAPRARRAVVAACIGLAGVVATAPRPEGAVERLYGRGLYPLLQRAVTSASNLSPVALFDVMVLSGLALVAWWLGRAVVTWRATHRVRPLGTAALRVTTLAAVGYVWFTAVWGLNYARPPLDVRLGLLPGVATETELGALATLAVAEANAGYTAAHADPPDDDGLARALQHVERTHGRPTPTAMGRPKRSLLGWYFRAAGVDGLTAPFFLETLLNPDLTDAERPFVLAHEWAHLSGYAAEADANFAAWLTTMASDSSRHRYSGWLFIVSEAARQLPSEHRRAVLATLSAGPRRDLEAIARRSQQRIDLVERVGWRVYDGYLRAQGVDEGIRSYSRVVELIVRARRTSGGSAERTP